MQNQALILEKISKRFLIGSAENKSALKKITAFFSGREEKKEIWALEDISFCVGSGNNFGIIGKNGSGKSTLLKLIAGIYAADRGKIKIKGRVAYVSGFGQGLNQKLTMRENICLLGSLMGISPKNIKKTMGDIIEFSGLNEFINTKIYQFSSGMITRLGFTSTVYFLAQSNPDILLLDDVFGSGADFEFENKAIKKMEDFIRGGTTVILASHTLDFIEKYCDEVLLIEKGKVIKSGDPKEIINIYRRSI